MGLHSSGRLLRATEGGGRAGTCQVVWNVALPAVPGLGKLSSGSPLGQWKPSKQLIKEPGVGVRNRLVKRPNCGPSLIGEAAAGSDYCWLVNPMTFKSCTSALQLAAWASHVSEIGQVSFPPTFPTIF